MPFEKVYQGGHHDIWCDGETHVRAEGGWCHEPRTWPPAYPVKEHNVFRCDCARWAKQEVA